MDTKPNILLIILDAVRAKNCSIYNHSNKTTPFLSEFAEEAVFFEQAHSPSIHSVASHTSIFTGYHVEEHNITEHESRINESETIWYELNEKYGYKTGIFSPNSVVVESSNLAEPFEKVSGPRESKIGKKRIFDNALAPIDIKQRQSPLEYLSQCLDSDKKIRSIINGLYDRISSDVTYNPRNERGEIYINDFFEWLDQGHENWAGCLNLIDAHSPYVPLVQYDRWAGDEIRSVQDALPNKPIGSTFLEDRPIGQLKSLESLYDGCIRQLDSYIQELIKGLKDRGEYEDTLIVITSDHGEGFGEQSPLTPEVRIMEHNWGISEELTHVPLLVKEPEMRVGQRISKPATLTAFPSVVRAAINEETCAEEFVTEEAVLSSTCRIMPPGDMLPLEDSDRMPYFGPWRAIYREEEGDILKYCSRNGDEVKMRIIDAQTHIITDEKVGNKVDSIFSQLKDAEVSENKSNDLAGDLEERLVDLGYMR